MIAKNIKLLVNLFTCSRRRQAILRWCSEAQNGSEMSKLVLLDESEVYAYVKSGVKGCEENAGMCEVCRGEVDVMVL